MNLKYAVIALLLFFLAPINQQSVLAQVGNKTKGINNQDSVSSILTQHGQVIDSKSKRPIPYATLFVKGEKGITAICDENGYYTLTFTHAGTFNIVINALGYLKQELPTDVNKKSQKIDISLKPSLNNLDEVVVTGTRTEKTLANAPVLTQLISSTQLIQNDFENVTEALEYNIPGLQFNSDPRGNNIRIQGLENKYILILVDGERLSATPGGPIDFDRLSMSNVKQIEVIKGASSALYGSSAIGMIVNIITNTPNRKLEGWGKVRYSKYHDLIIDASVGTAYKDLSAQTLFYRSSHDGYDLTKESPELFTKDPSKNMNIEQKVGWENENTKIAASGSYYFTEVTNPPLSSKDTHYRSNNRTWRASINQRIGSYNIVKASYYGDFYTRRKVFEAYDQMRRNATSNIQTIRLINEYTPLRNIQTIVGGEYNWNRDFNEMQYGKDVKVKRMNDKNAFGQVDWQVIPLLNVIGGFRYTHHSVFGSAYSPKLNLMFSLGNWRIRGGYSKGFKTPDPTELYSDFMMGSVSHNIGNPDLKAEKSNYYYLSAEYQHSFFNASIDIYQNDIDNKIHSFNVIVQDPNGIESTELRYDNVDEARIRGVGLSLDLYPIRQLLIHANYSYTDAEDLKTHLQLSGNTKHSMSCNITYKEKIFKRDMSIALAGRWSSKKINEYEKSVENPVTGDIVKTITKRSQSAYSLWKLTVMYTPWKWNNMEVNVSGGIQNIFNYTDPIRYTTYDPGRRFFGSLTYRF